MTGCGGVRRGRLSPLAHIYAFKQGKIEVELFSQDELYFLFGLITGTAVNPSLANLN